MKKLMGSQDRRGPSRALVCSFRATAGAALLTAGSSLAFAQTAMAQQVADVQQGQAKSDFGIETVIVTSERREERLLDVPQSISALTDQSLQDLGANSFTDYVGAVPNVQFTTIGPGQTTITIRGISAVQGVSTIGYYLNDTPITSRDTSGFNQPDPKTFDVERVEILRGPQGTLYGGGAMGGAIRIITKQPDLNNFDFAGDITGSGTKGGGFNYNVNGMVNVPIVSDKFAIRLAGGYGDYDGWIDDPFIGKDVNSYRTNNFRGEAKFAPTNDLSLTFMYQHDWLHSKADNLADTNTRGFSSLGQASPNSDTSDLYSLTGVYDLKWASLTMVGSYATRDNLAFKPFSNGILSSYEFAFGLPDGTFTGGGTNLGADSKDYNVEARLVSEGDGPFQWVLGGYYLNSAIDATTFVFTLPPDAVPFIPGGIFLDSVGTQTVKHFAIYGEGTYNFTDDLALTVGLRWFDETVSVDGVSNGFALDGKVKSDRVIPKATLTYKFDENTMAYFTYSDGFRSGGANLGVDPGAPLTYQPDTTKNFELGAKGAWLDGKIVATGAIYYIDWDNMQVYNDPTPPQTIGFVNNAGKAKSEGAEIDLNLRPVDAFHVELNGSYSQAVLTEALAVGSFVAPSGNWLPYVPQWKFFGAADYSFPLWDELTGRVRGDVQFTGKSWGSILNELHPRDVLQPSYTISNMSFDVVSERWTAELFVHNVFDQRAILRNDTFGNIYENRPRTIGITLRYNE